MSSIILSGFPVTDGLPVDDLAVEGNSAWWKGIECPLGAAAAVVAALLAAMGRWMAAADLVEDGCRCVICMAQARRKAEHLIAMANSRLHGSQIPVKIESVWKDGCRRYRLAYGW